MNYTPRNLLLQAIGPTAAVAPDVKVCEVRRGDLYLLCSDGLYGNTPHGAIAQVLERASAQSLDACCEALVALAKAHGSQDNITAVLVPGQHHSGAGAGESGCVTRHSERGGPTSPPFSMPAASKLFLACRPSRSSLYLFPLCKH